MLNIKDLYIQGDYIDTPLGKCYFIKVSEYPELIVYRRFFDIEKHKIVREARKDNPDYADILEKMDLVQIIKHDPKFREMYNDFFTFFFKDERGNDGQLKDFIGEIKNDDDLEAYLELFKDMNCIKIEKENPNPEIEKFNKLRRKLQELRGQGITYESMFTSVWVETGEYPGDLTLYQFYKLFDRISQFKKYDTSTLIKTVSPDLEVEPWYKEVKHEDPEQQEISEEKFNKMKGRSDNPTGELL